MPGLLGIISNNSEELLFKSMQKSINHNNYMVDEYQLNGIHLARLHHGYVTPFKQPYITGNKKYGILFNGEIFSIENQQTSSTTDSSHLFFNFIEHNGVDNLTKINGQFSACIYDFEAKCSYLLTDRFGTHPLYYTINKGRLLFASEVKAILKDDIQKTIDYHAIAELFSFGHLFGYKTLFENIHQVPPATLIKINGTICDQKEYWTYPYNEDTYYNQKFNRKKSNELEEELKQILLRAINKQSTFGNDILLSLSGGLDSRYVAALYNSQGIRNMSAYTMGPDNSEDQIYASQVAAKLGLHHHKFDNEPERIWEDIRRFAYVSDSMASFQGTFKPLEYFSQSKKITAAAQGCDAIFGSTLSRKRIRFLKNSPHQNNVTNEILTDFFITYDQNLIKQLLRPEIYNKTSGLFKIEPQKYCTSEFHPLHNYFRLIFNEHVRRCTLAGNLITNYFFETRMISFDNDVFSFGLSIPVIYREHQYIYRKVFCQLFPELAQIRRQGNNLKIGASNARYEMKHLEKKVAILTMNSPLKAIAKYYKPWTTPSYMNYNDWFKNKLRNPITELLIDGDLKSAEILNVKSVKSLVNDHLTGKKDNSAIILQIINLEYFYRNFIAD